MEYYTLRNGVKLPKVGYGTYKIPAAYTADAVQNALKLGYRHIDTATYYQNEVEVGAAINNSGINRKEIFVTTKLWTSANSYDSALSSIATSLRCMHLDYIDMVLIHWPTEANNDVWCAMEDMYNDGKIKVIGVSNFKQHHIDSLMETAKIAPMVNQVELHPYFQQRALREYCTEMGIQMEAWSPLLRGGLIFDNKLTYMANKYGKSISQIALRFLLQEGISVIPKTLDRTHMAENINIFDFELTDSDMESLRGLNKNMRYYRDPDHHGF